jgi:hypothetical protein
VPKIEKEAYYLIGKLSTNVNQIARRMHQDRSPNGDIARSEFDFIDKALTRFACYLLGIQNLPEVTRGLGITKWMSMDQEVTQQKQRTKGGEGRTP